MKQRFVYLLMAATPIALFITPFYARDLGLSLAAGRIAARNSCQGPWTHTANLSISFNPIKVRMPQRATLSFSVTNPLGAADLALDMVTTISRYETGKTKPPLALVKLFKVLDRHPDLLEEIRTI